MHIHITLQKNFNQPVKENGFDPLVVNEEIYNFATIKTKEDNLNY